MNCDLHIGFQARCAQCATDRFRELDWLCSLGEVWTATTVGRAGFPSTTAAERAARRAGRSDVVSRLKHNHQGVLV